MNTMIFCFQDVFDLIPDFSINYGLFFYLHCMYTADHFREFKNKALLFSVDNLKAFVTGNSH